MAIHFLRTQYNYESYTDFWRLVELSGFPISNVGDAIDYMDPDTIYITTPMNGEWRPWCDPIIDAGNRKSEFVLWNLERPGGSGSIYNYIADNQALVEAGYFDRIIVSDKALADFTRFHFVPLGSHKDLGTPGSWEARSSGYAYAHLSCYSNHRSFLFDRPDSPKTKVGNVSIAPNGWGDTRHNNLQRTRRMLTIHQDNYQYCEPLRIALAAAYGMPVLSECLADPSFYNGSVGFRDDLDMSNALARMYTIDSAGAFLGLGEDLRNYLTNEFTFRKCLEIYL